MTRALASAPGGTLLEIAVQQGRLERYLEWLRALGVDHVEVSNGSLPMTPGEKHAVISQLANEFTVVAEVGKKGSQVAVAEEWVAGDAGRPRGGRVSVITEGRESGTSGSSTPSGAVRVELVDAILHALGTEAVIFEAPQRTQQAWLLEHVGPSVNLGNILVDDVIALEDAATRPALRDARPPARARPAGRDSDLAPHAQARGRDQLVLRSAHRRALRVDPRMCVRDRAAAFAEHRVHGLRRRAPGTVRVASARSGSSASTAAPSASSRLPTEQLDRRRVEGGGVGPPRRLRRVRRRDRPSGSRARRPRSRPRRGRSRAPSSRAPRQPPAPHRPSRSRPLRRREAQQLRGQLDRAADLTVCVEQVVGPS